MPVPPDPLQSTHALQSIRALFPALRREHAGQPVAYFDGPGGTQVPEQVVDAMADYLFHHNANTHWHYPSSIETDALIGGARETFATFFNAPGPETVSFGQNMTTITFHLARALVRGWGPGDEIVVTALDHQANIDPWRHAARDRGLTVQMAGIDAAGAAIDWPSLEAAITPRTRLVAVGAASNAIGTITDVAEVARLAHAAGALVFVDAVHFAPHVLVDVQALDCDFLACSAYKFYGPHAGVLYGRADLVEALDLPKLAPAPSSAPGCLETGTQSHEAIVGAAAAVRFLAGEGRGEPTADLRARLVAGYDALHRRAVSLTRQLWEGLGGIPGVTRYGPGPDAARTPTVSFTVEGWSADDVSRRVAADGLFVSSGDFYASTLVERLGLAGQGLVRVGCACYTSEDEVDRLVAAIDRLTRR
jgi:cysteine desulfurase family protein (TIGR01976 family)